MKTIFLFCALTLAAAGALIWRAAARPSSFGSFSSAAKAPVAELIANPTRFLGKTVAVEGTISAQCKSMGCFFFFRSGKSALRVDLQEIAMHAPMREGRRARVEGQIVPYDGGYQLAASGVEFE
jgi:hypothetical protein